MIIGRIEGANIEIAKDQPEYGTLPALAEVHNLEHNGEVVGQYVSLKSAWYPTPDELERLNKGASVVLTLLTRSHPPCRIDVGEVPR